MAIGNEHVMEITVFLDPDRLEVDSERIADAIDAVGAEWFASAGPYAEWAVRQEKLYPEEADA